MSRLGLSPFYLGCWMLVMLAIDAHKKGLTPLELKTVLTRKHKNQTKVHIDGYYDDASKKIPISHEKRLTKYLNRIYSRVGSGGRPIVNSSAPLIVRFGLAVMQMGLDERDNMMSTSVWCRYRWRDEYIRWDPAQYGGIKQIRLPSSKIWIPDIMLYNTADTHKLERDVLVVINNNGSVLWIPHRIYHSSCSVNVANYPFDHQSCGMTFGSWAYHGNEIDLGFLPDMEMLDISELERESSEWEIISKSEERKIQHYDCCVDPYVTLTFTVYLKRKLVFSSFILTLPCTFLACMTLVVFWLPPERPDRTGLAMSLFASFLLLLLILVETAPPTASSVPTLGLYYCFNMVIIMMSIFLSSIVININRKGFHSSEPVPEWVKKISLNGLAVLFCQKIKPNKRRRISRDAGIRQELRKRTCLSSDAITSHLMPNGSSKLTQQSDSEQTDDDLNDNSLQPQKKSTLKQQVAIFTQLASINRQLRLTEQTVQNIYLTIRAKQESRETRDLRQQWQTVATTLDRLFFLIFLVAIIVSLIVLFPRPYSLQWNPDSY